MIDSWSFTTVKVVNCRAYSWFTNDGYSCWSTLVVVKEGWTWSLLGDNSQHSWGISLRLSFASLFFGGAQEGIQTRTSIWICSEHSWIDLMDFCTSNGGFAYLPFRTHRGSTQRIRGHQHQSGLSTSLFRGHPGMHQRMTSKWRRLWVRYCYY